jgi:dipeptidyl aminopeptidase/acylaminoacyl peptidase
MRKLFAAALLLVLGGMMFVPSAGAQYYFGRNKVQYNNFDWQVLRTTHFDIYFYPEMEELAKVGAAFAEEAYERLEEKFEHSINRRIPLIFYSNHSHFQQTNTIPNLIPEGVGGFFEFLKGRVVIPANGSIFQFKHVINHELVHVFTQSKLHRVLKDHKRTNVGSLPLWLTEGLAEYWSVGWDSQAEMFLRDAVLNGYLVPVSEMYRIYGSFLMYKEGQAVLKFIAENFGEEKILQLFDNIWKEDSFSKVMKLTIGLDYKEFDEQWSYHLKKKTYPLMEGRDSPSMTCVRVTSDGINTKPTYYRYDGRDWTVFVSNRVGYSNIYQVPLDGRRKPEVLIKGERTSEFEAFHLLRSKIDANNQRQLVFVSKSGETDAIYVYDIGAREVTYRFRTKDIVTLSSPSWAPDGRRVVFNGVSFSGKSDLYIVDVQSGALQKLTNDFYDDRDPAWSPDGKVIAFSSDRTVYGSEGYYNLFLYDLETGDIRYVTYGKHNDYSPAWSPDGRTLAFSSDRDGAFNIWLIRNRQLTSTDGDKLVSTERGELPPGAPEMLETARPLLPYPSALESQDILKQVTFFATGAFDPVWTERGSLLFTAFENFSFQIRELTGVEEKFETAPLVSADSIAVKSEPWKVESIVGNMAASQARYERKFSLDVAQSQITQDPIFGVSGGAQLAMTDMLGNYQYYFLIYNNAQTRGEFLKSFNVAVSKVNLSRRANLSYGLYHLAGRFYDPVQSIFYWRRYGGFFAMSYPFSVFRRMEGSINFRRSEKDRFTGPLHATLLSNFISYVKDNSLWGASGPIDGERFNYTFGYTADVTGGKVSYFTLIADYRRYFRLSRRITFATRVTAKYNLGKEAERFFMGGSWDLRLYPRWRLWGRKLFLVSNELRFPFIDAFLIRFPFGGMGFNAIRGAAFVDLGNAWDSDLQRVLGSFGLGIRWRVGGFLVLRFDIGRRFYIDDYRRPYNPSNFHLKSGVYRQFFFGWDF